MSAPNPEAAMAPAGLTVAAAGETAPHRSLARVLRDIALFFAAPFVTIACVSLFPFIGMAMLWRARRDRKPLTERGGARGAAVAYGKK